MSEFNSPATLAELRQACPGASSDFLLGQIEAGATVTSAMHTFIELQSQALSEERAAAKRAKCRPGTSPVGNSRRMKRKADELDDEDEDGDDPMNDDGDPVQTYHAAVRAEMKRNGGKRMGAIKSVLKRDPDLHLAFSLATNDPQVHDRIRAKFGRGAVERYARRGRF